MVNFISSSLGYITIGFILGQIINLQ